MNMSDNLNNAASSAASGKSLVWQTPMIHEDMIDSATTHFFSSGVDNYEGDNPVGYGS